MPTLMIGPDKSRIALHIHRCIASEAARFMRDMQQYTVGIRWAIRREPWNYALKIALTQS